MIDNTEQFDLDAAQALIEEFDHSDSHWAPALFVGALRSACKEIERLRADNARLRSVADTALLRLREQVEANSRMQAERDAAKELVRVLGDAVISTRLLLLAYETDDGEEGGTCIYCDCTGGHEPGCHRQRVLAVVLEAWEALRQAREGE